MRDYFCVTALILCAAASAAGQGSGKTVDLQAADGTALKGTYFAAAKPGPGILLLHMCNSQRTAWNTLAPRLTAAGFHVMTLDLRGFGESGGARFASVTPEERQRLRDAMPGDIDAAYNYLITQPGVDRARMGAAGGSCGVNNAIQLARRHTEVKALVLLAGNTNTAGESFLQENPGLPVLASASRDDGNAVEIMRWVLGFSAYPGNRFLEYATGGHGTEMFAVHKDLEPAIVAWFDQHLVKQPVRTTTVAPGTSAPRGPAAQLAAELRAAGGGARLLEKLRAARQQGGSFRLPPEAVSNQIGYDLLQAGRTQDAIGVFLLNVEAFPTSANVYDSLSDGYVASGQRELAIQFAEKALQKLAGDPQLNEQGRALIRESAEAKLRDLRKP
jgi:dienelactone hydrolase